MKRLVFITTLLAVTPLLAGTRVVVHRPVYRHTVVVRTPVVRYPNLGFIDINCNQDEAKVYVNGKLAGIADQFDGFPGKLTLKPGAYRIVVASETQRKTYQLYVTAGHEINLHVTL